MQTKIVSPDEFWEKMCSPWFLRTGLLQGTLNGTLFITIQAPEDVPGFIESKIAVVAAALADPK